MTEKVQSWPCSGFITFLKLRVVPSVAYGCLFLQARVLLSMRLSSSMVGIIMLSKGWQVRSHARLDMTQKPFHVELGAASQPGLTKSSTTRQVTVLIPSGQLAGRLRQLAFLHLHLQRQEPPFTHIGVRY